MTRHKYNDYDLIGPHKILLFYKYKKQNKYRGIFQCPFCGKSFDASIYKVANGNTTRCNLCTTKRRRLLGKSNGYNLIGKKFGKLTVVKRAYSKKVNNHKTITFWECKCECSSTTIVDTNHLTSGHTQSCGCLKSLGEYRLSQILSNLSIDFEREKTFNNLKSPYSNNLLRFDFYLPKLKCCIECDGKQHNLSASLTGYYNNKIKIDKIITCDKLKNKYCYDNNISLYRIPEEDYHIINENYIRQLLGEIG